jgi:hypothetical protein
MRMTGKLAILMEKLTEQKGMSFLQPNGQCL